MIVRRRSMKRGRVEIIPLIDTILILLIFYMSLSRLTTGEKQLRATLPTRNEIPPAIIPVDISLYVQDGQHIVVGNGVAMSAADLAVFMQQFAMVGQQGRVQIAARPDAAYADVIAALDACALARFDRVGFVPTPTGGESSDNGASENIWLP